MDKCFFGCAVGVNAIAHTSADSDDWVAPTIVGVASTTVLLRLLHKKLKPLQAIGELLELDENMQVKSPDKISVLYACAGVAIGILGGKFIRYACKEVKNKMTSSDDKSQET
jgi:hypothetical protein